jgi:hypothetical protein
MVQRRNSPKNSRRKRTLPSLLKSWERSFRADFARDSGAEFEPLLERFGLRFDVEAMLEGTVDLVTASAALAALDGVDISQAIGEQKYDPQTSAATYALTFEMAGHGVARLLVTPGLDFVDLADLYEYPWHRLETVGYSTLWVSRIDGEDLSLAEVEELERLVTADVMFDFGEDEVSIIFDPDSYDGALAIIVYDTPQEDLSQ